MKERGKLVKELARKKQRVSDNKTINRVRKRATFIPMLNLNII